MEFYGVVHHNYYHSTIGVALSIIYKYNRFKMAFKDTESLQWRTFVQTLGKGSKTRYVKTIINFKEYHAKVMETCAAWTMEEVLYNPSMENAPTPGWFPLVPESSKHKPTHDGGYMTSTLRSTAAIVVKYLDLNGHKEAAESPTLFSCFDMWEKLETTVKANVFSTKEQTQWSEFVLASNDCEVLQNGAYSAIATDCLSRSCESHSLNCDNAFVMEHKLDVTKKMIGVDLLRSKGMQLLYTITYISNFIYMIYIILIYRHGPTLRAETLHRRRFEGRSHLQIFRSDTCCRHPR